MKSKAKKIGEKLETDLKRILRINPNLKSIIIVPIDYKNRSYGFEVTRKSKIKW